MTTKTSGPSETVEEPTPFRIIVKEDKRKGQAWETFIETVFFLGMVYCFVFIVSVAWHDGAR